MIFSGKKRKKHSLVAGKKFPCKGVRVKKRLKSQCFSNVILRPRYNRNSCRNVCFQELTDVPSKDATFQASVALAWVARGRQSQTRYDFGL